MSANDQPQNPVRTSHSPGLATREVEREGARIRAILIKSPGALVALHGASGREPVYGVAIEAAAGVRIVERIPGRMVRALAAHGILTGTPERYTLASPAAGAVATPSEAVARTEESPLAWLAKRTDANGQPMISADALAAGERLRADFTAAQMTPRVTAHWDGLAQSGKKRRGPGRDPAALSDTALAAKQRLDKALQSVGPELAGLLLDVCCFLIGLEQVESQRGWPRRSAKVILKIALARLAAHYGYGPAGPRGPLPILQAGTADYRPKISADRPEKPFTQD